MRSGRGKLTVRNGNGHHKVTLLTREQIDGRTASARQFDAIVRAIAVDLGGADQMTEIQKHLVAAFAGAALHVQDLNAKLMLGQEIDISEHAQAVGTLTRIARRLPLGRVAREVPTIEQYLAAKQEATDAPASR